MRTTQQIIFKIQDGEYGLYKAEDDYGTSYYFRGASTSNYVNFAGFTWRIVRINGDGSIRLILDKSLDEVTKDGVVVYTNSSLNALDSDGLVEFNKLSDDNAYLGYMFGTAGSNNYENTHKNSNDSTVKTYIDTFYKEYLLSYQGYLADTLFCGDKTRGNGYTTLGYGNQTTYYSVYDRLYKSSTEAFPTLKCASNEVDVDSSLTEEQRSYSRYTSIIDTTETTLDELNVNNSLTYPTALLSADELVMAGAFRATQNLSFYLYRTTNNGLAGLWWTMTPSMYSSRSVEFIGHHLYSIYSNNLISSVNRAMAVRPVINLSADVLWASGDGTSGDGAYTVSLPS